MHRVSRPGILLWALLACSSLLSAQSWSTANAFPAGADAPTSLLTADLLGNQVSDVLAVSTGHNLLIYQNDGAGHLNTAPQTLATNVTSAAAARFSGTRMDDVLAVSSASASAPLELMLMPSEGSRVFGASVAVAPQLVLDATCHLSAADFNNDGIPDVLVACTSSNSLFIGINNGGDVFSFKSVPGGVTSGRQLLSAGAGDLDGGGLADIIIQSAPTYNPTASRVDVLWGSTAGTFTSQQDYVSLPDATALYIAKVDGHISANLAAVESASVSLFPDQTDRSSLSAFTASQVASGCNVSAVTTGRIVDIKYSIGQDIVAAASCDGENELLVFPNISQVRLTLKPSLSYRSGVPALSMLVTVANADGTVIPTGTVAITLGTTSLQGTLADGTSQIDVQPSPGTNILHVNYSGDSYDAGASETADIVLADNATLTGSTTSFVIDGPTISPASNLLAGTPYKVTATVQQSSTGTPNVLTAPTGSIAFSDNGVAIATVQGVPSESLSPWANSDCSLNGSQWVGTQCATDGSGSYPIAYEQDTNLFTSLITFPTSGSNLIAASFVPAWQGSAAGVTQSHTYQVATTSQTSVQRPSLVSAGVMSPSFSRLTLTPMASSIPLPASGIINTIAGDGTGAVFYYPDSVAVDLSGNVYIGGTANYGHGVSELASSTGGITVIPATVGSTGTAENLLGTVEGLAVDGSGNLFISDGLYLYEVSASTGIVHEVAGSPSGSTYGCIGTPNNCSGYSATAGAYSSIGKIAVDTSGHIYLVDQGEDSLVRKVTLSTGIINTVAGSETGNPNEIADGAIATSAGLLNPQGVAVDSSGNVYIAEAGSNRIRKVTAATGIISTVAGNGTSGYSGDGGLAISAELNAPVGVSIDANGNLYIADSGNNRIREVSASTGVITTTAGTGTPGFAGDGGAATNAELNSPHDVKVDSLGNIYIADSSNDRIRVVGGAKLTPTLSVSCSPNTITYGSQTSTCTASLSGGTGSYSGTLQAFYDENDWCSNSGVSSFGCTGWNGEPAGGHTFSATYSGDSGNNSLSNSTGLTINKATPSVTFTTSPNPASYGQKTTTNVQVGCNSACGDVDYRFDGGEWDTVPLNSSGGFSAARGPDLAGSHTIQVNYLGNANYNAVSPAAQTLTINKATPSITVSCTPNTSVYDSQQGPLTTCVASVSGGATGTVAFYYNGTYWTAPALSRGSALASGFDYGTAVGSYDILASYSGDSNDNPVSASTTFVVTKTITVGQLGSSVNPSSYGQGISFTSLINTGGVTPTGTVTFQNRGTSIGTGAVSTVSTTNLLPYSTGANMVGGGGTAAPAVAAPDGSNTVASFDSQTGDPYFMFSDLPENIYTFSVWLEAPSGTGPYVVSLYILGNLDAGTSCNVTTVWQRCSITATTNTTSAGVQVGQGNAPLVYMWGAQLEQAPSAGPYIATNGASLSGNGGLATLTTSSLPVGSNSITAVYDGAANDFASTSAPLTQTVTAATPTLSVASSGSPSPSGASVIFTATISSGPTGTITFYDGGVPIGTGAISGTTATFITSSLAVGSHSITAGWAGDTDYSAITSSAISQVVNQGSQTITFTSLPSPVTYGVAPVTLSATSTSGLPVTFSVLSGPGAISGNTLTINGAGTIVLAANQAGNANYLAAPQVTQSVLVNKNTPTITWTTPAAITYGTALSGMQLNATSGGVAGTFAYTPAAGAVLGAGSQTLSVTFTPTDSTDYTSATGTTTLTVNKVAVVISISSTVNPSSYGSTITFTFTFSGVAGGAVPTGLAQISDGASSLGTLTLNSSGVATFTTSTLVAGTHSITATYQGDSNYR